ncbi:MAG: SGNH/GDSL hydrolase family protein [Clostridia bacterium]
MELKDAVINVLGDSITEGVGASCEANRFTDVLQREFHMKAVHNYGISGSRIARQPIVTDDLVDRDFCMRTEEFDPSADAMIVFGGTNDYGHGAAPLGVSTDREPQSFYGACHYMMSNLLTRFVGKPVVIVTPLHRLDEDNPRGSGKPCSVAPLRVYRDILLEVAAYYALPVLDLYATSGIQPANEASRERLCPDGLHPSDEGHALIAHRMGLFLQTL